MKKNRFLIFLLTGCLTLGMCGLSACTEGSGSSNSGSSSTQGEKTVSSIEVSKEPAKTDYYLNEEFSAEGGEITVTYSDGSTEVLSLTDDSVELSAVNTSTAGTKTVTVRYGGKSTRFNVTVSVEMMTVTFQYNDGVTADEEVEVEKGEAIRTEDDPLDETKKKQQPEDPVRDGYEFQGWFTDSACTMKYDFEIAVSSDFTLYAGWVDTSVASYNVIYNYNHDGLATSMSIVKVEEGNTATKPAVDPERTGYAFIGWYTAETGGELFDFENTPITERTLLYAHWEKTATGVNTYTFEAENLDLTNKTGPGLSGTASEGGMIVNDASAGASGNAYLSFLYTNGTYVTFYIISDEDVDDVTFEISLSMECRDYTFNQNNYAIIVNNNAIEYEISFTGVPVNSSDGASCLPFKTYTLATNMTLKKGRNEIVLMTANNDALAGTTMVAAAPLVDCIMLTSTAVLTWDGSKGLPKSW